MSSTTLLATTAVTTWHHGDVGTGWWIVMMIGMVAFWALVIVGIVWLVRTSAAGGGVSRRSAREVLDERLAQGEIEVDEYERRLAAIEGRRGGGSVPPTASGAAPPAVG